MDSAKACLSVVIKTQDPGPAYHYACTQWWRDLELTYQEEPRSDSDITNMLETLQDSSVRAAWHREIIAMHAFIALAKVGWASMKVSSCCLGIRVTEPFMIMKKFNVDDLHECVSSIVLVLKVRELDAPHGAPPSSSPPGSECSFVTCHVSKLTKPLLPLPPLQPVSARLRPATFPSSPSRSSLFLPSSE